MGRRRALSLVAVEAVGRGCELRIRYHSGPFTFRCCALSLPEGGVSTYSFFPACYFPLPAPAVPFPAPCPLRCFSPVLPLSTQAHVWGHVTLAGSAFQSPSPASCAPQGCARGDAASVRTGHRLGCPCCSPPAGLPGHLPRCPWPVLCVRGPALCLWGWWHPYLGFPDISTCFFNFVIISNRKVGRAPWRTYCVPFTPSQRC